MKIIIKILLFLFGLNQLMNAQIVPDFIISENGSMPMFALDNQKNMHVVWESLDSNIGYSVFDSSGNNIKPPQIIPTYGSPYRPYIRIKGTNAVIIWTEFDSQWETYIAGTIIDISTDTIYSYEISLDNKSGDAFTPDICFNSDTTFIVVWSEGGGLANIRGVYGQIVSTSLNKIGNVFLVIDHGRSNIRYGEVKVLVDPLTNDFVVIWRDNHTESEKIYGRLFYSNGEAKDSSFLISEDPDINDLFYLSTAIDRSGNFVVAWGAKKDSDWQVQWRWFDNNGKPAGPGETIANDAINDGTTIDVSIQSDGKGVVVWEKRTDNYYKLYGQRFNSDKELIGGEFKLSSVNNINDEIFPCSILSEDKIYSAWLERDENRLIKANIIDFNNPPTNVEGHKTNEDLYFYLYQNYPNPSNPTTTINYQLPSDGFVNLKVYDILGSEVTSLVNEVKTAGTYNAQFNAGNLSSGVYIYRLKINSASGSFVSSKKMVVTK